MSVTREVDCDPVEHDLRRNLRSWQRQEGVTPIGTTDEEGFVAGARRVGLQVRYDHLLCQRSRDVAGVFGGNRVRTNLVWPSSSTIGGFNDSRDRNDSSAEN
jgi:hypothetical protein